jgi:uncharacterized membrane protein
MNRAIAIILIPVVLVAAGYIVVLRGMGFSPGYGRLALMAGGFAALLWFIHSRSARAAKKRPAGG